MISNEALFDKRKNREFISRFFYAADLRNTLEKLKKIMNNIALNDHRILADIKCFFRRKRFPLRMFPDFYNKKNDENDVYQKTVKG
jgi:hypothetical protein